MLFCFALHSLSPDYFKSSCSQAGGFTKLWVLGTTIPITALSISTDNTTWLAATQNTGDAAWIQSTIEWSHTVVVIVISFNFALFRSRTTFPQTVYLKMTSLLGEVLYDSFQWTSLIDSTSYHLSSIFFSHSLKNLSDTCGTGTQTMQPDRVAIQGQQQVQFNGFTTTITPTTSSSSTSSSSGGSTGSAGSLRLSLNIVYAVVCVIAYLAIFM